MTNPVSDLVLGFQDLVAQMPDLLRPVIVALAGAVPFIEGEGAAAIGIVGGIHPVVAALAGAFLGAILVMKPGFCANEPFAACCALAGGLGAGLAYACVHELGRIGVGGALIIAVFSAFSCLCAIPFIVFGFTPLSGAQLAILLGAGVGAAIGQFGVTAAYRLAEPRVVAVFDYMNIIFTSLFGFFFFSQKPDTPSIIGFVLIIAAAIGMNSRVSSPRRT